MLRRQSTDYYAQLGLLEKGCETWLSMELISGIGEKIGVFVALRLLHDL